jgi:hypothetical protein
VKGNQPRLHEAVQDCFTGHEAPEHVWSETSTGHGRHETRCYSSTTLLPTGIHTRWPSIRTALRVVRTRSSRGATSTETTYAITSREVRSQLDLQAIGKAWRGHWAIENRLHHVRDVVLREDACRARKGNAAQAHACLRNLILGVLTSQGDRQIAATLRQYRFGARHWTEFTGSPP